MITDGKIHIMSDDELNEIIVREYNRGVERGRFEARMDALRIRNSVVIGNGSENTEKLKIYF
jgi:hypothetical protein